MKQKLRELIEKSDGQVSRFLDSLQTAQVQIRFLGRKVAERRLCLFCKVMKLELL